MKMKNSVVYYLGSFIFMILLCSCASQPTPVAFDPPGFFTGFWNGLTIFFSLIGHIFNDSIRIYAFPNSGGWYDFGFFLGVATVFGGGGSAVNRD
jgi:hypothetical protein